MDSSLAQMESAGHGPQESHETEQRGYVCLAVNDPNQMPTSLLPQNSTKVVSC